MRRHSKQKDSGDRQVNDGHNDPFPAAAPISNRDAGGAAILIAHGVCSRLRSRLLSIPPSSLPLPEATL